MFNKIKIFSISTNEYKNFTEDFLYSFQRYFLPNVEKEFFLFTDYTDNPIYKNYNLNPIYINHEKWPLITLKRYHAISNVSQEIKDSDLCIFADIDLKVEKEIPNLQIQSFFGVEHPGNYLINNIESLETNSKSLAFVNPSEIPINYKYIQGCLWGGIGGDFINMINTLKENSQKDFINGIVAKWHDESHLNRFCISNINKFNFLSSSYAYPEKWNLPIDKIIIHKEKNMERYPRFQGSTQ